MADKKMTRVKALVRVKNNGTLYQPGEEFQMEHSLVDAHVAGGQVEEIKANAAGKAAGGGAAGGKAAGDGAAGKGE